MVIELDSLFEYLLNNKSNSGDLVIRRTGPKVYNESHLMYMIKNELIKMGLDVIKKRMWKDGHLVDNEQQYIRDRKGRYCFFYTEHALRFMYEDYNNGSLILRYEVLQ